ncbi:hypothetical protein PISL3812_01677 [Talaromyces islandicus]|uniref:Uncharacterized protein n=1 Tax=Talaromyces islandicus TaxID=28573 RepID=A0A0U1LMS8_TALIS|nr:hypothetical protein PISL3812_01677 [Talaromyces islandicus]
MPATQGDRQPRRESRGYAWVKRDSVATNAGGSEPLPVVTNRYALDQATAYAGMAHHGRVTRLPSPRTMLDGLRDDPFSTLPMDFKVTWDETQLYDLWTTRLSYWSGQNIRMKEKAFRAAMRHRTSFEALILGYCARWKPHLDGKPNGAMIQYYDSQVQFALSRQGANDFDDDSLSLSFTGLILQEERFGDKQKTQLYAQKAKNIQLYRKSQPMDNACRSLLFFILCIMKPPSQSISMGEKLQLVDLLHTGDRFMTEHATKEYLHDVPRREDTFHFKSPIYQLLSSGPRPSQVPVESRNYVVNKNTPTMEWSRTAALIYIVLALYDYRGSKNKTARFLDHLHYLISKHDLDRNPACESFIFFLVEESYDADLKQPNRAWQTNELLNIHKKLPSDLQFRFNDTLLSFLTLVPPVNPVDDFEEKLNAVIINAQ